MNCAGGVGVEGIWDVDEVPEDVTEFAKLIELGFEESMMFLAKKFSHRTTIRLQLELF